MSTHPDAAAAAFRHDTERARAVRDFIAQVKALAPDPARATSEQLAPVARLLEALGRRAELFPAEAFAVVPGRPTSIYRLAEDADGGYALYLSLGEPGKAQPPHDHTTWAIIAGVSGNERNEVYARSAGNEPGRAVLTHVRRVDVAAGNSIVLGPADVHTIELVGDAPGAHLHFYGLALDRLHGRVVFESTAGGAYRTFRRRPRFTMRAFRPPGCRRRCAARRRSPCSTCAKPAATPAVTCCTQCRRRCGAWKCWPTAWCRAATRASCWWTTTRPWRIRPPPS